MDMIPQQVTQEQLDAMVAKAVQVGMKPAQINGAPAFVLIPGQAEVPAGGSPVKTHMGWGIAYPLKP
jgi:hypothetical protein